MAANSFSPKFVLANVSFVANGASYDVGENLINARGVPGFKWTAFNPAERVGQKTQVSVRVVSGVSHEFSCGALFTCERTEYKKSLGLQFVLPEGEKKSLDRLVEERGVLPDFVRKFPRIAFDPTIGMMPSHAALTLSNDREVHCVCDVDDLSPTGLQVYTEDPRMAAIQPAEPARVTLFPRGSYCEEINLTGLIRRVIHTVEPTTGNERRYFGLNILPNSPTDKAHFLELMRLMVEKLRK